MNFYWDMIPTGRLPAYTAPGTYASRWNVNERLRFETIKGATDRAFVPEWSPWLHSDIWCQFLMDFLDKEAMNFLVNRPGIPEPPKYLVIAYQEAHDQLVRIAISGLTRLPVSLSRKSAHWYEDKPSDAPSVWERLMGDEAL